jgi:hypothetical protein
LRYQACDDKLCYPPVTTPVRWTLTVAAPNSPLTRNQPEVFDRIAFGTGTAPAAAITAPAGKACVTSSDDGLAQLREFTVVASTGGYRSVDDFLTFIRNAENGVKEEGWFEGRGPLAILLLVFFGGLALNLTPCVLPMIPIIWRSSAPGRRRALAPEDSCLAAFTAPRWPSVYGLLGVVVITTASTFGTINASPWFNLVIAIVFVVLSLAMFDVLTIDFSRFAGVGGHEWIGKRVSCAGVRHGRYRRPARWRVRRTSRDSSGLVFERSVRAGNGRGARFAVPARHWHGRALADCRSRPDRPAEAGRLDGEGQAGLRGLHPRHGCLTTAISRMACSPIGG